MEKKELSRNLFPFEYIKANSVHLLVIPVFPISMDLVFQGEIKGEMGHFFLIKDLHSGFIRLILEIPDHVREPDNKAIVTGVGLGDTSGIQDSSQDLLHSLYTC